MTIYSRECELFEQVLPLFNAMGDATRQQIVRQLGVGVRLSVAELTELTQLSRPAVSHHLKILREAGIVQEQKEGRKRYYTPIFSRYLKPLRELIDCVEKIEQDLDKNK